MKNIKFTEEEKLKILIEHESGFSVTEVCKRYHISRSTFYKWQKKSVLYVQRFKTEKMQLIEENMRLREIMESQNKYIEELLKEIFVKKVAKVS
jgi:putative transposase